MKGERYTARAVGHTGRVLAEVEAASVDAAVAALQSEGAAIVRGEYTSDGTHWGPGRGRVLAIRERGVWVRL